MGVAKASRSWTEASRSWTEVKLVRSALKWDFIYKYKYFLFSVTKMATEINPLSCRVLCCQILGRHAASRHRLKRLHPGAGEPARSGHSHIIMLQSWPWSDSWPHILRKGWSRYAFFRIMIIRSRAKCACGQTIMNEVQQSQMVKSHFVMWSSNKATKQQNDGQKFWLTAKAMTTTYMGVTTPWPGARGWEQESRSLFSQVTHETLEHRDLDKSLSKNGWDQWINEYQTQTQKLIP